MAFQKIVKYYIPHLKIECIWLDKRTGIIYQSKARKIYCSMGIVFVMPEE